MQSQNESDLRPVPPTVSHMFGEAVWVLTQSPLHKQFKLEDLEWMLMPPLLSEQYRIFRGTDAPIGLATWAFLNEECEQKLLQGKFRLKPDEWKCGDRMWLVDLVTPAATPENKLVQSVLTDLQKVLSSKIRAAHDGALKFQITDSKTGKQVVRELPIV